MFDDVNDVIGFEEHVRDEATHADYMREAYGDACPSCGRLRWGGDCGNCYDEGDEREFTDEELDTFSLLSVVDTWEARS